MCTTPRKKTQPKQQQPVVEAKNENNEPKKKTTTLPSSHKNDDKSTSSKSNGADNGKLKKTIYVKSAQAKKLTGKRGRKKKELMNKSGAEDIQIMTSAIGNYVPVHFTGSRQAVWKAIALIQEAIGMENVTEKPPPPPAAAPTPVVVSPQAVRAAPPAPAPVVPSRPVAPPAPVAKKPVINSQQQQPNPSFVNPSSLPPGFEKPAVHQVSTSESETQPTSQYSFGDALLPPGLMGVSPTNAVPSEIGIHTQGSQNLQSVTEASISSLNDRSNASKTQYSNLTLNENDPLLVFLRSQHQCIKGDVGQFYVWLVKSEDIDSMTALKEAVSDEDYLNDNMKVGNGSSGLKGFKRKAFQRAVNDYVIKPTDTVPPKTQKISSNDSTSLNGMNNNAFNGNAFLPSNLFGNDDPSPATITKLNDPPEELVCPISLVLMTVDPVLAADGVTYERLSIENWFRTNMAKIQIAEENLKWNPRSEQDLRVVATGVLSPAFGVRMKNLALRPNIGVRNMARAYKERMVATS